MGHFGDGPQGLTVAVAHLSLGAPSRQMQLDFIAELLHDFPNAVLMGDFNCVVDCPEMGNLFRKTRLQPPGCTVHTFPSWKPQRAIDHILVTDTLRCQDLRAVPAAFSDHLALSVNLEVPEGALAR